MRNFCGLTHLPTGRPGERRAAFISPVTGGVYSAAPSEPQVRHSGERNEGPGLPPAPDLRLGEITLDSRLERRQTLRNAGRGCDATRSRARESPGGVTSDTRRGREM